jgi:hypothetical protein
MMTELEAGGHLRRAFHAAEQGRVRRARRRQAAQRHSRSASRMSEEQVRSRLAKIATQQKEEKAEEEEEGEQEVWILKKHPQLNYLLVRFNGEHRLVLVTAVVHQPSKVRYADLADLKDAEMKTDGRNYAYTWKIPGKNGRHGYAVVARGSDPQYLNSYSLYRLR